MRTITWTHTMFCEFVRSLNHSDANHLEACTKRVWYNSRQQCGTKNTMFVWRSSNRVSENWNPSRFSITSCTHTFIDTKQSNERETISKEQSFYTSLSKWRPMIWNNAHTHTHTSTNSTRMFPFQFIITMYVVWWPFEQWIDARLSLKLILNWCS